MEDDDLHLARLSIADLHQVACTWHAQALKGDKTAHAIAEALASVVTARRYRAASIARVGKLAATLRAWPALRKLAEWTSQFRYGGPLPK